MGINLLKPKKIKVSKIKDLKKGNKIMKDEKIDFGSYVSIEMKRYGPENEMYTHKVIRQLKTNNYVDVPVQSPARNYLHKEMQDCVACIVQGIDETEVLNYRISDVTRF